MTTDFRFLWLPVAVGAAASNLCYFWFRFDPFKLFSGGATCPEVWHSVRQRNYRSLLLAYAALCMAMSSLDSVLPDFCRTSINHQLIQVYVRDRDLYPIHPDPPTPFHLLSLCANRYIRTYAWPTWLSRYPKPNHRLQCLTSWTSFAASRRAHVHHLRLSLIAYSKKEEDRWIEKISWQATARNC